MMPKERLTKSKGRIKKYGEVFTPEWVVKMMVDELEKSNGPLPIEATVLEPSCGEGAFLKEVLHRKLDKAKDLHGTIAAVRSVYGVELLPDNTDVCRRNLFDIWCAAAKAKGIRFGRPPGTLPENFHTAYQAWKAGKITVVTAAKECNMPLTTFRYRAQLYGGVANAY